MALFFTPVANVVLGSVPAEHEGKASGANNAIRELGGVFGVAVLASVFAHMGGYRSGATFVHGTTTAVYVGGAVVALGAIAAGLAGRRRSVGLRAVEEQQPVVRGFRERGLKRLRAVPDGALPAPAESRPVPERWIAKRPTG